MLNTAKISVDAEVVCAPPALYLAYVRDNLSSRFQVAGQNCYKVPKGAYTGIFPARSLEPKKNQFIENREFTQRP